MVGGSWASWAGAASSGEARQSAAGSPAKEKGPIEGTPAEFWVQVNPQAYRDLAQRHVAGIALVEE